MSKANIILESHASRTILAGFIARLLVDAGAEVTLGDDRISIPAKKVNLKGLAREYGTSRVDP
jgi:hypothetical protein